MNVAATILTFVGCATAFAPAQQVRRASSALAVKPFSDALGAMAPVSIFLVMSAFFIQGFHILLLS
jgi:hypothetical protein